MSPFSVLTICVSLVCLLAMPHAVQGQAQMPDPDFDFGSVEPPRLEKPPAIVQGLIGSPFKLRVTPTIFLFFLGLPIGGLAFSAALFFTYIHLKSSPVDIPLVLS